MLSLLLSPLKRSYSVVHSGAPRSIFTACPSFSTTVSSSSSSSSSLALTLLGRSIRVNHGRRMTHSALYSTSRPSLFVGSSTFTLPSSPSRLSSATTTAVTASVSSVAVRRSALVRFAAYTTSFALVVASPVLAFDSSATSSSESPSESSSSLGASLSSSSSSAATGISSSSVAPSSVSSRRGYVSPIIAPASQRVSKWFSTLSGRMNASVDCSATYTVGPVLLLRLLDTEDASAAPLPPNSASSSSSVANSNEMLSSAKTAGSPRPASPDVQMSSPDDKENVHSNIGTSNENASTASTGTTLSTSLPPLASSSSSSLSLCSSPLAGFRMAVSAIGTSKELARGHGWQKMDAITNVAVQGLDTTQPPLFGEDAFAVSYLLANARLPLTTTDAPAVAVTVPASSSSSVATPSSAASLSGASSPSSIVNASAVVMAIADGVGGWNELGVDPSKMSHALMEQVSRQSNLAASSMTDVAGERVYTDVHPKHLLDVAYTGVVREGTVDAGSTTACVVSVQAVVDRPAPAISASTPVSVTNASSSSSSFSAPLLLMRIANLGDSGCIVMRQQGKRIDQIRTELQGRSQGVADKLQQQPVKILTVAEQMSIIHTQLTLVPAFISDVQMHGNSRWDAPFQLAVLPDEYKESSCQDMPDTASSHAFQLQKGDIVFIASDGVFDNFVQRLQQGINVYENVFKAGLEPSGQADLERAIESEVPAACEAIRHQRRFPNGALAHSAAEVATLLQSQQLQDKRIEEDVLAATISARIARLALLESQKGPKVDDISCVVSYIY